MMAPTRELQLLELFVALADSLVDDFDVVDLLQRLVDECISLFDAAAAGILLLGPSDELEVIVSTSERSELVELMQLRVGEGPCVEAVTTGAVVSVDDIDAIADRWPAFAADARASGFAAIHAIPLRLRDSTLGSLNLLRDEPGALNAADAAAARALADIATISILQQRLVEESELTQAQLQRALDSRVVIEQAKGYLAQRQHIDMDEAFARIRSQARSTQARIGVIAADIIAGRLLL
ncbi:GAF domain-containing protein [Microbacterium terrae]|uniref:ANTAR domain protein n=1 Tax=Microbacterium terrae TaxID=69369 RepID=A0A0M2H3M7_9MICO|nr:GAF and ANTAR domain-containing protein [Microbacterium terrae]KJL38960.1 ANTAR domain protein [Microbacterium terrae]MBP1077099.1 GAF domain-containing protein [Microbacterium terrae]GLJ99694.1 transcriptional regulator [Microbacterium terrae]